MTIYDQYNFVLYNKLQHFFICIFPAYNVIIHDFLYALKIYIINFDKQFFIYSKIVHDLLIK